MNINVKVKVNIIASASKIFISYFIIIKKEKIDLKLPKIPQYLFTSTLYQHIIIILIMKLNTSSYLSTLNTPISK